ncbi:hypothetical protein [Alteromonas sp. KUL42]|nr:hypothetical protein [Alteromonas sp. KUL42]
MSEWFDSQNKQSNKLSKLLRERIEKANPRSPTDCRRNQAP